MEGALYISELLEQHDCVIIPGLGGFVGSYHPAGMNTLYHTFQPPYKKLLFNINLRHNDGLLADHIAREEHIPFAQANEKVRMFAEECQLRLRQNKQILIRNVGRVFMGQEGTIQFDQDLHHNLLPESFGLQPFFSVPAGRAESTGGTAETEKPVIIRQLTRRALSRPLKWAALLALPVGLAILLSISGYDRIRTNGLTYADVLSSISLRLSPFSNGEKKADPMPIQHAVSVAKPAPEPVVVAEQEQQVAPEPDRPFAIIIGAFRIEENAIKLIARLQGEGLPASLFDVTPGGLHRVAAGTFADRTEAIATLRQIRLKGFDGAWLLVK